MDENSIEVQSKSKVLVHYEKYMFVVGILGQLLFFSQGFKIFLTKSAGDVSIFGFLFGLISVSSWLIYGIMLKNKVLISSNAVAVIGALLVVIGILIYGN